MSFDAIGPRITVIIPAYCEQETLHRSLLSIQLQTHQPHEVIVCDDGSTQPLRSTVQEFSRTLPVQYIRIENTGGAAGPRNVAVESASGDWIAFLDADDVWQPQKLMSTRPYLLGSADVVYHKLAIRSCSRPVFFPKSTGWSTSKESEAPFDLLSLGNPIPTSGALVRRSLYCDVGGMSTDDAVVEDYDFWIRVAWAGARFKFVPLVLGQYFLTPGSQSSSYVTRARKLHHTIDQHLNRFSGLQRAQIESYMEFSIGIQFLWAGRYREAEQHLSLAKHLRSLKQRLSRNSKLLSVKTKLFLSPER